eukprot:CAMPEP_0194534128 /NCGR_PEP_ID=MMETSP0253-20130528/72183_1 /TAXON_ID=2966 /ORGANISM="Noctiluca scintillans" /LENGTH=674 /DNA_ID=CAMNT_0039379751 /DNA_START=85 /DNA_END=2105 /DNA_ORIENTATION=+
MDDARFDTSKDPRFRRAPRNVRKVEVDKRFEHMFTDKRFVETAKVDSRGNRLRKNSGKLRLEEFYHLAGGKLVRPEEKGAEADVTLETPPEAKKKGKRGKKGAKAKVEDPPPQEPAVEKKLAIGSDGDKRKKATMVEDGGDSTSDESSTSVSSGSASEDDENEGLWDTVEAEVPAGDATKRFAIMGCDWDRTRPVDLLLLLRSYLGQGASDGRRKRGTLGSGSVDKVSIYPSDYGLERMAYELEHGPPELGDGEDVDDDGVESETEKADFVKTRLNTIAARKYQRQKVKYYYAVAECDSVATASWLYEQLDGIDADGICPDVMDLRFVPDDTVFPHEPKSVATEVPRHFDGPAQKATMSGHTNLAFGWDLDPPERQKALKKKRFTADEIREMDMNDYLGSSSESGPEEAGGAQDKRKALGLMSEDEGGEDDFDDIDNDKEAVTGNIEVSFNPAVTELSSQVTKKVRAKEEDGGEGEKTTWQKYLERRKDKRKARKEEVKAQRKAQKEGAGRKDDAEEDPEQQADLEILAMGTDKDNGRGFNARGALRTAAKRAEKQAKKGEEDATGFSMNVDDPRIAGVFSSADFSIDPTNPHFRPTEGMKRVLKKKREKKVKAITQVPQQVPLVPKSTVAAVDAAVGAKEGNVVTGSRGGLQLFAARPDKRVAESSSAATEPA